jgi:hypothetical protein
MRIGIDFDNTIACYDGVFHAAALELGLLGAELGKSKNAVRDHLNNSGKRDDFTRLQGYIYGARMDLAAPYPGIGDFIAVARAAGHEISIISHKTRHPILGPQYDMHEAAAGFLAAHGLVGDSATAVLPGKVFFELTKEAKLQRIAAERIEVFIDDLPEILLAPGFPAGVRGLLFDPENSYSGGEPNLERCTGWPDMQTVLLNVGRDG